MSSRGTPAKHFFVNVISTAVTIVYRGTHGGRVTRYVKTPRDFKDFFTSKQAELGDESVHVLCSSSLDWPEEYTDVPEIILLADLIRGNNVSGDNPEFTQIYKIT